MQRYSPAICHNAQALGAKIRHSYWTMLDHALKSIFSTSKLLCTCFQFYLDTLYSWRIPVLVCPSLRYVIVSARLITFYSPTKTACQRIVYCITFSLVSWSLHAVRKTDLLLLRHKPIIPLSRTMASSSASSDSQQAKANKLIHSKSPYLLQHAYNPVEW